MTLTKTKTCGWCRTTGIPVRPNGDLEPHKANETTNGRACQGYATYRQTDESIGTDWWRLPW
jgi:hypothetical protein